MKREGEYLKGTEQRMHLENTFLERVCEIFVRKRKIKGNTRRGARILRYATYIHTSGRYADTIPGTTVSIYNGDGSRGDWPRGLDFRLTRLFPLGISVRLAKFPPCRHLWAPINPFNQRKTVIRRAGGFRLVSAWSDVSHLAFSSQLRHVVFLKSREL